PIPPARCRPAGKPPQRRGRPMTTTRPSLSFPTRLEGTAALAESITRYLAGLMNVTSTCARKERLPIKNGVFLAAYILQEPTAGYDWRTEPPINVITAEAPRRFQWTADMAVQVAGVEDGKVTDSGCGYQVFETLADAKKVFPDLDPEKGGER